MKLTRGDAGDLAEEDLEALPNHVCPDMNLGEFIRWTRIHGTMLALQAGTPALCIAHDSRTLELCQTMKMPHVTADSVPDGVTRDELISLFDFDPEVFDENRRTLCKNYIAFLKRNTLRPVRWLQSMAEEPL